MTPPSVPHKSNRFLRLASRWLRTVIRGLLRSMAWAFLLALMIGLLRYSTLPLWEPWTAVAVLAKDSQFDYVSWELDALAAKVNQTLYGLHPFMGEAEQVQTVRAYMADLGQAQALEVEINRQYADPAVNDPATATAEMRAERDSLRASLQERQSLVEAVLEGQIAAVLVDEGFGWGGQLLPPIAARFTRVPNLLVVSPRDQIRFDISINLDPMPVDAITELENTIDEQQDVSSLIVPLGGIALYPAMVLETSSIPWALETVAHEWLHHYLFFYPLGLSYFDAETFAGEARIINETTANIFGKAVSRLVLARYYPDLLPPQPAPDAGEVAPTLTEPPAFDFGTELDITRREVDTLLGEGKVDAAEAYMEARREDFAANGYLIRKLNQAYFAFYGGYQSGAPGAGGEDPIGPAVQAVLDASPSLYDWIVTMRTITTREELLAAMGE
ncbi:MAG: hypothetical protein H6672_15125 [Anaerolineaceae bacterium]|nr:hypothetical protein [Anaerolineaceae bacterium]